jgi:hypothetical protein
VDDPGADKLGGLVGAEGFKIGCLIQQVVEGKERSLIAKAYWAESRRIFDVVANPRRCLSGVHFRGR